MISKSVNWIVVISDKYQNARLSCYYVFLRTNYEVY